MVYHKVVFTHKTNFPCDVNFSYIFTRFGILYKNIKLIEKKKTNECIPNIKHRNFSSI